MKQTQGERVLQASRSRKPVVPICRYVTGTAVLDFQTQRDIHVPSSGRVLRERSGRGKSKNYKNKICLRLNLRATKSMKKAVHSFPCEPLSILCFKESSATGEKPAPPIPLAPLQLPAILDKSFNREKFRQSQTIEDRCRIPGPFFRTDPEFPIVVSWKQCSVFL